MAQRRFIGNMVAPWRFLTFLALLAVGVPVATDRLDSLPLGAMAGFDVAAIAFLLFCAPLIQSRDPAMVREHAKQNDANRTLLLVITGIVMVVLLAAIGAESMDHRPQSFIKGLIIATLALAWLFSNMVYTFHYIHLAYGGGANAACAGIDFPGTPNPLHWDFVYFAFTVGMTSQTSDVIISDPMIRRFVTWHALGAFAFNIGVLAFTINVLGSG